MPVPCLLGTTIGAIGTITVAGAVATCRMDPAEVELRLAQAEADEAAAAAAAAAAEPQGAPAAAAAKAGPVAPGLAEMLASLAAVDSALPGQLLSKRADFRRMAFAAATEGLFEPLVAADRSNEACSSAGE